ncbi:hypothetical protein C8039_08745 [Halogeometricum sp. wsp3]|nr:hypothetical protein C8039_08745 [Halogeometricum sp. wsp3]
MQLSVRATSSRAARRTGPTVALRTFIGSVGARVARGTTETGGPRFENDRAARPVTRVWPSVDEQRPKRAASSESAVAVAATVSACH